MFGRWKFQVLLQGSQAGDLDGRGGGVVQGGEASVLRGDEEV